MHQDREDLDIVFRKTAPERILNSLNGNNMPERSAQKNLFREYDEDTYQHFAFAAQMEYSENETAMRYRAMRDICSKKEGVFALLYQYADKILVKRDGVLACKLDEVLGWNSVTKRLGQDLFTTSWLAHRDCEWAEYQTKHLFTWPAVLATDDVRLNGMLKRGTAENHFHLNGSTQSFALSWASLMNHPNQIRTFIKEQGRFMENRFSNPSRGINDNAWSWDERLLYAAMIRAILFERVVDTTNALDGNYAKEEFGKFDRSLSKVNAVKIIVERLRKQCGSKFSQPDKTCKCLDYAISGQIYHVQEENHNRLLAGERAFLYRCFMTIYRQDDCEDKNLFSDFEKEIFYLYLLIKHNFRSEMIQVNQKTGFYNFAKYQDRKDQFFSMYTEYIVEAQRLAVISAMHENYIKSFENRIMVQRTRYQLRDYIGRLDKYIKFPEQRKDNCNYYVIHFPKKAFTKNEFENKPFLCRLPRNVATRNYAERCARELRKYLMTEQGTEQRVLGIDACSNEIGCRPEAFATEFRYLRKISEFRYSAPWYRNHAEKYEELGVTYHAGEDFLDIVDGLRAIDETITFLELRSSDRLGHAIALGIMPTDYYEKKHRVIYLTKQDYLDDLVWLLYRSLEWSVVIDTGHCEEMRRKARELFCELYANRLEEIAKWHCGDILDIYYDSWKLRGDHPELYYTGKCCQINRFRQDPYERFMERAENDKELSYIRNNELTNMLYYWYHYDTEIKKKALCSEHFEVTEWYIKLVGDMQKAMRRRIAEKGIGIECNPTSNVLISNFEYYSKHPILAFNHYRLDDKDEEPNLWVSINTDDIGVFDTSLSNEYALLYHAISRQRHEENKRNDDVIYEYLDCLRQNGLDMAFKDYIPVAFSENVGSSSDVGRSVNNIWRRRKNESEKDVAHWH